MFKKKFQLRRKVTFLAHFSMSGAIIFLALFPQNYIHLQQHIRSTVGKRAKRMPDITVETTTSFMKGSSEHFFFKISRRKSAKKTSRNSVRSLSVQNRWKKLSRNVTDLCRKFVMAPDRKRAKPFLKPLASQNMFPGKMEQSMSERRAAISFRLKFAVQVTMLKADSFLT